jgi:hypothetical protein
MLRKKEESLLKTAKQLEIIGKMEQSMMLQKKY